MNSAIFVVLVLLLGAECRPVGQDVLAGEDFLAFLMRSHRPRGTLPARQTTAAAVTLTTEPSTESETAATTVVTEPTSVVAVWVSSSVRKEALHENSVLPASSTRSNFGVEATGYREAEKDVEDSLAEATQDFPSSQEEPKEDKKPYAEALTVQESGLGYESRVSSETSQSRVYFSRPEPVEETVVVQTSQTRKYEPRIVAEAQTREERKYVPGYQNDEQQTRQPEEDDRQYSTQTVVSQTREERHYNPHSVVSQNRESRQQFSNQPIISQPKHEFESQKILGQRQSSEQRDYGSQSQQKIAVNHQYVTQQPGISTQYHSHSQESAPAGRSYDAVTQQQAPHFQTQNQHSVPESRSYNPANQQQQLHPQGKLLQQQEAQYKKESQHSAPTGRSYESANHHQHGAQYQEQIQHPLLVRRNYEADNRPQEERNYEQPEENYEVDEAISVMTNGRAHGVQTERPQTNKFGLVQEGENYRKYRVEEKTPDGFIVGEYGVVNHDDGGVRGVRYTADGSISPRLIYEALVKFLSLK